MLSPSPDTWYGDVENPIVLCTVVLENIIRFMKTQRPRVQLSLLTKEEGLRLRKLLVQITMKYFYCIVPFLVSGEKMNARQWLRKSHGSVSDVDDEIGTNGGYYTGFRSESNDVRSRSNVGFDNDNKNDMPFGVTQYDQTWHPTLMPTDNTLFDPVERKPEDHDANDYENYTPGGGQINKDGDTMVFPPQFRTISGRNSGGIEEAGASNITFVRRERANYADGSFSIEEMTSSGAMRPNARDISNALHQPRLIPNFVGASDWLWQWGQFIDHDFAEVGFIFYVFAPVVQHLSFFSSCSTISFIPCVTS